MPKTLNKDDLRKDVANVTAFLEALEAALPGHVPGDLLGLLSGASKVEPILDLLYQALTRQAGGGDRK